MTEKKAHILFLLRVPLDAKRFRRAKLKLAEPSVNGALTEPG